MQVRDIMNPSPAVLGPNSSLGAAPDRMAENRSRHVVVVHADEIVGILSDRDLAMFYDPNQMTADRWEKASIGDLMTPKPMCIESDVAAEVAAKELLRNAVSALPVVKDGKLAGILSEKDFVRHFAGEK